ncbi:FGGY-family carbohydrate kinase [Mucilaginibacter gynuensis]|uniref:FGGY-family carbohydrate kinase n=1 Tax=Mucilaginibacter gynuensis TaxID=1302236 RepID=A0ABP8G002_9SPHI
MQVTPVIAIFDAGKTNKKLFLFDENYRIVYEKSARFIETVDEDGFPCENLESLRLSVFDSLSEIFRLKQFKVMAVNFSTYGASFVYVDENGRPLTPLYNYLKEYPDHLSKYLYDTYGGESQFAADTASPVLGSLNSGLQLFRLKNEQPEKFAQLKYALHLPQYLSFLLSGSYYSDITSIGCHTALWNFDDNDYHQWIKKEGIAPKLAQLKDTEEVLNAIFPGNDYKVGIGLHDSSAALIPYLVSFSEPFILISTGTWCISMNPFNQSPLTGDELKDDCLCYLQYQGKPVKASRLFAGYEHEQHVKRIAEHFGTDVIRFRSIPYDPQVIGKLQHHIPQSKASDPLQKESIFKTRDLHIFENETEAYHQLMLDIMHQQVHSTNLVLQGTAVKRIFVDGGFSKNAVYMNLLSAVFPGVEVFAASMAQATAIGAALAIHSSWNTKALPGDIIELKHYSPGKAVTV